jgi:type II secretory pathway pseudopilin PulG
MRLAIGKSAERGTTLAEVVIATAILGLSIAGIMGAIFSGFFAMDRTRENQRATQIILEKLETIRLYKWSQVVTPNFIPNTFSDSFDPQAPQGSRGITYYGTLVIEPFPYTASYKDKMRQVTVTLIWTSKNKLQRSRSFITYIAKDGVQNYVY